MAGKVNPLISMVAANQANYPCQARSLPLGTLIPPMSAGLGVLARGEQAFAAGHRTSGLRLRRPTPASRSGHRILMMEGIFGASHQAEVSPRR